MIKDFFVQVLIPYFQQWNLKFFLNILRYGVGCFFECFPISSSMVNSLFYSSKQEKSIEKNNVNLHLITGIAGLFFFLFLRWNLPYEGNIYLQQWNFSAILIYFMVCAMAIGYYHFFEIAKVFPPLQWFIGILGLMKFKCYIPLEILNIHDFFSFIGATFNVYVVFNLLNMLLQKFQLWIQHNNKPIKLMKYTLFFTIIFLGGHHYFNAKQMFIYTIILSKLFLMALIMSPLSLFYHIKYLNLLSMATFTNSYFNGELYNLWDILIVFFIFFYGIVDKFFHKYGYFDHKNLINDNLLKFLLWILLVGLGAFFLITHKVIGMSMYWITPLGLLVGMPFAYKIKNFIYKTVSHKVYNYQSIATNILMTLIFIGIYCFKFIYQKGYYVAPPVAYFLIGFSNSWALMPGFSRMLLTFLMGFLLMVDINEIILLNYFLLFITSIGQWFIFQWEGAINMVNIHHHLNKKVNQILLLFNYKKNPQKSLWVVFFLVVWSFFLMYKFLPSLYTSKFWWQSIGFRIFIAGLFLLLLKYKNIDTKFS